MILASQAADQWRAPQFVWQVRDELGEILCGDATRCEKIDTGGYTVRTTLDYRMQRIVEKWVYAAAIVPNSRKPTTILKNREIPRSEWGWITGLAGHNLHNAAAGRRRLPDRRGPRLLGVRVLHGQGQQEVPAPVRRPVRRLSPARLVDQAAGVPDRHRRRDDDGRDDVHGRRHQLRVARFPRVLPDPGRWRRARPGASPERAAVLAQHPRDQGRDHQRHRPHVQQVPRLRAVVPSRDSRRRVRGHRHARHPSDRDDQRVWRDRRRRRPDAAPHDRRGHRRERQGRLAAEQRQGLRASASRRARRPTS